MKQLALTTLEKEFIHVTGPIQADAPLIISCGMGTDSVAMLVGMKDKGIKPDNILFADVGNEFIHTYIYLAWLEDWLKEVDFPPLEIVRYQPQRFKWHRYQTLAGNCLANRTLPGISFGRKSCSLKWKGQILDKRVRELYGDQRRYRAIGYDCSPRDDRRFSAARGVSGNDVFIYPLQMWSWDRKKCRKVVLNEGLPDPHKSSCTFCLSIKPHEVNALPDHKLIEIVIIEANATPKLRTVKGLWRKSRITDYISDQELLPQEVVDDLWAKWSQEERIVTDKEVLAEDVIKQEVARIKGEYLIT